jgi:hypothetical protein
MRSQIHTATGSLIVVQEQRFHLLTDRGQGLLLTLAHTAPVQMIISVAGMQPRGLSLSSTRVSPISPRG